MCHEVTKRLMTLTKRSLWNDPSPNNHFEPKNTTRECHIPIKITFNRLNSTQIFNTIITTKSNYSKSKDNEKVLPEIDQ